MYIKFGEKTHNEAAEWFYTFLTTPDRVLKFVESFERNTKTKLMGQSSYFDNYEQVYSIEMKNILDL